MAPDNSSHLYRNYEQFVDFHQAPRVSLCWKWLQILVYLLIVAAGVAASAGLSQLDAIFHGACYLYSNLTFVIRDNLDANNKTVYEMDWEHSFWSSRLECNLCQYVPFCSIIYSFIWMILFCMCGPGGYSAHGPPQPWRIVLPALIFNGCFAVTSSLAAARFHHGFSHFCNAFIKNNQESRCDHYLKYVGHEELPFESLFQTASINLILMAIFWCAATFLLLLRCLCVIDFRPYEFTVLQKYQIN